MAILYAAQVAAEEAWRREHGDGIVLNGTVTAVACPFTADEATLAEYRGWQSVQRDPAAGHECLIHLLGAARGDNAAESFRGSIGSAFPNLQRRTIVNTR